jgi:hypothetical protein
MKLLGNPWVVGGLCVIAAGIAGYQFLWPSQPGAPRGPVPAWAASPANPPPAAPAGKTSGSGRAAARTAAATNGAAPVTLIETNYVLSHLDEWTETPRRDPFLFFSARKPGAASPVTKWKLKAIWRQTGSRLAAINKGVYAEGDQIEGYRIEAIESDRVWFQGPDGRESLGFEKPRPPAAGTNAPAIK